MKHNSCNEVTNQATEAVLNEVKKRYLEIILEENVKYENGKCLISDKTFFGGQNALAFVSYIVTKKALGGFRADYLPTELVEQSRFVKQVKGLVVEQGRDVEDYRSDVTLSLIQSMREGKSAKEAIDAAYAIFDSILTTDNWRQKDNKTLPKEEVTEIELRLTVEDLCSTNPKGVDDAYDADFTTAVYELFDRVKKAHKYATDKRWEGFKYFILGKPNNEIADLLALSKQKVSSNNREMVQWVLDEVKKMSADSRFAIKDSEWFWNHLG